MLTLLRALLGDAGHMRNTLYTWNHLISLVGINGELILSKTMR